MERNGNTGGNNKSSDFEDIMREGGVSDEFTSHRWDIPDCCASCPELSSEMEELIELANKIRTAGNMALKAEEEPSIDAVRRLIVGSMNLLDKATEEMQASINRMTKGCLGAILLSGESDRTGRTVRGAVCDSPTRDSKTGVTISNEPAIVIREDSQKTKEYGESDNPSGEQDS